MNPDYAIRNPQSAFEAALCRFDGENSRDPNLEAGQPRELLYAQRLTGWVLKLCPDAPEELRLAARCQHICRWSIPRESHEMTRAGYLLWRNDLKQFHARKAGEILRECGYPDAMITRVQELNLKKNFPTDPLSRVMEDALCLVFLQYQFVEFAAGKDDAKVMEIVRKTWKKMTPEAHAHALALPLRAKEKLLIQKALAAH